MRNVFQVSKLLTVVPQLQLLNEMMVKSNSLCRENFFTWIIEMYKQVARLLTHPKKHPPEFSNSKKSQILELKMASHLPVTLTL